MGQITTETIAMIRRAVDANQAPPLTLWEFRQLAFLAEKQIAAQQEAQPQADEKLLRKLLAIRVAGASLYGDDGELQDNSVHPCIDFKRDSAMEIERKLLERGTANARKSIAQHTAQAEPAGGDKEDAELLATFLEWARQVSARADVPKRVRLAAAGLAARAAQQATGERG